MPAGNFRQFQPPRLEYTGTLDHVPAKDMPRHAEAINQLAQLAVSHITSPQRLISRGNGLSLLQR